MIDLHLVLGSVSAMIQPRAVIAMLYVKLHDRMIDPIDRIRDVIRVTC